MSSLPAAMLELLPGYSPPDQRDLEYSRKPANNSLVCVTGNRPEERKVGKKGSQFSHRLAGQDTTQVSNCLGNFLDPSYFYQDQKEYCHCVGEFLLVIPTELQIPTLSSLDLHGLAEDDLEDVVSAPHLSSLPGTSIQACCLSWSLLLLYLYLYLPHATCYNFSFLSGKNTLNVGGGWL